MLFKKERKKNNGVLTMQTMRVIRRVTAPGAASTNKHLGWHQLQTVFN